MSLPQHPHAGYPPLLSEPLDHDRVCRELASSLTVDLAAHSIGSAVTRLLYGTSLPFDDLSSADRTRYRNLAVRAVRSGVPELECRARDRAAFTLFERLAAEMRDTSLSGETDASRLEQLADDLTACVVHRYLAVLTYGDALAPPHDDDETVMGSQEY